MSNMKMTRHAEVRSAQRGIGINAIELVMSLGTEVEGGYILLRKDIEPLVHFLKREIDKLRRLEGKRIVIQRDAFVTAYHATQSDRRRLLKTR